LNSQAGWVTSVKITQGTSGAEQRNHELAIVLFVNVFVIWYDFGTK